jgi:hypothetical protein
MIGRPTRLQVTTERPAMTLSKAAFASKSVKTPGESVWRDRSKNSTLLRTALLHV